VGFHHPHSPTTSFHYPSKPTSYPHHQQTRYSNGVNPTTATGRSYSLTEEEMNNAKKILDARKLNN